MGIVKQRLRSIEERDRLVLANLPLVNHILGLVVKRCSWVARHGLEDARQIGYAALVRAADLWDESRGVRFNTYACNAIYRRIMQETRNCHVIFIPHHVDLSECPVVHHFSEAEAHASSRRDSLDLPGWLDVADHRQADEPGGPFGYLQAAVDRLHERHREVLRMRLIEGLTFDQCGEQLGVTRERVRQIEKVALAKLHRMLTGAPLARAG